MTQHPHILVFDSGVGGLSIAREILQAYPHSRLTYASDNAQFPYGNKAADWLVERVEQVMSCLIDAAEPDIVVVACNTASTLTLPRLRERFSLPFVGVVPAIKPAAHISRSKTIGVLATPATIARPYTQQLISDYAADCRVLLYGSGDLVTQAERKLLGQDLDYDVIAGEIARLVDTPEAAQLDTIVLACTHFPLLKQELVELVSPRQYLWIDSGEAIARRVGYWIGQLEARPSSRLLNSDTTKHQVVVTAPIQAGSPLETNLRRYLAGQSMLKAELMRESRGARKDAEPAPSGGTTPAVVVLNI